MLSFRFSTKNLHSNLHFSNTCHIKINISSLLIMVDGFSMSHYVKLYMYIFVISNLSHSKIKQIHTHSIFIPQMIHNTIQIIHTLIQTFTILNKMHSINDSYLNQYILYKIHKSIYFTQNKQSRKKIGTSDHITPTSNLLAYGSIENKTNFPYLSLSMCSLRTLISTRPKDSLTCTTKSW